MEAVRGLACQAQCASTKPQVAKVSKNRRSKSNFVQCAATAFSKFSKIRLNDLLLRISWPDATVQDLAYALRDGVLLCHTLHIIDPATLDMKQVLTCLRRWLMIDQTYL